DEQAALAVRLLRGPDEAERRTPAALDAMVAALSDGNLVSGERAFAGLRGVIDPDIPPPRSALMFDAAVPAEVRDVGTKAWKRYAEEQKKKAAGPKPPGTK